MKMESSHSCGSRASDSTPQHQPRWSREKLHVYNEVLRRIRESDCLDSSLPGFEEQLWIHFSRLPARYALEVNVERAEDVLMHKRLLDLAQDPAQRPAFEVRLVQVHPSHGSDVDVGHVGSPLQDIDSSYSSNRQAIHPPPTFGSSPNVDAVLQTNKFNRKDGHDVVSPISRSMSPMHEITFSTVDKLKLLSQLTSIVGELGLNILEAHVFSTIDGFSLDVFVVEGWPHEEAEQLRTALEMEIHKTKERSWLEQHSASVVNEHRHTVLKSLQGYVNIRTDGMDVWEIDASQLHFENKVGSGSFGDLYKGTYCSQQVAIKILKPDSINSEMLREFSQEVYIMRKIRHKNVVQFIGACTHTPNLCIVTEFMSRGSIYDFIHKERGLFKLPSLLRIACDISRGMNYLHQNNIIHRDLKTANLLMDEHEVVKVADFGVARVQTDSGVMTAETGTYRWMAPEVIEHKYYDGKADVFSFGIVLWELLARELPYGQLTPLQAAVGVVQKGLRPTIPKETPLKLTELLGRCWEQDPVLRPDFSEITQILVDISNQAQLLSCQETDCNFRELVDPPA